jgi:hypothetical protein
MMEPLSDEERDAIAAAQFELNREDQIRQGVHTVIAVMVFVLVLIAVAFAGFYFGYTTR